MAEVSEDDDDIPQPLKAKPVLLPHQECLLEAFFLLSPDRPIGGMGGMGCIPTVAIYACADEIGEDRQTFLSLCRIMDGAYLAGIQRRSRKK